MRNEHLQTGSSQPARQVIEEATLVRRERRPREIDAQHGSQLREGRKQNCGA